MKEGQESKRMECVPRASALLGVPSGPISGLYIRTSSGSKGKFSVYESYAVFNDQASMRSQGPSVLVRGSFYADSHSNINLLQICSLKAEGEGTVYPLV